MPTSHGAAGVLPGRTSLRESLFYDYMGNEKKDALPLAVLHGAFLPIPQCMWKGHAPRQPRTRR